MGDEMKNFEIIIYSKENGEQPIDKFLTGLNAKMRARVLRSITLLRDNGNELREPHTKALKDGLFELRVQQSNDIARILYFFMIGRTIVLLKGFVKKTQKTPSSEINLANKYRADYLNRL